MVDCIILDGWHKGHMVTMPDVRHKGHMVTMPDVRPVISLLKPPTITIDDCCDGEPVGADNDLRKDYKLAFVSTDREMALYSVDGSSKSIKQRGWITPADKNWLEQPLYVGIHDPNKSLVDYKTLLDEE